MPRGLGERLRPGSMRADQNGRTGRHGVDVAGLVQPGPFEPLDHLPVVNHRPQRHHLPAVFLHGAFGEFDRILHAEAESTFAGQLDFHGNYSRSPYENL